MRESKNPHESGLNCIHQVKGETGLCPYCEEDYADDPLAWVEYGEHADGLANWWRLQDEMLSAGTPTEGPALSEADIPF